MRSIKNTITEYPAKSVEDTDKDYNIALEINICAKSPIEAARLLEGWLRDRSPNNWHFYVQDDNTRDVYSVDLAEEDEDHIVIDVDEYYPIIRPRK